MQNHIVELITAVTGTFGFCLIFRLNIRLLIPTLVGSFLCWGVYLISLGDGTDVFIPSIVSSMICSVYAQIIARFLKAPVTVFLIPEVLPLIPGSGLYYTMSYAVQKDWGQMQHYGYRTLMFAVGISAGICVVGVFNNMVMRFLDYSMQKRNIL